MTMINIMITGGSGRMGRALLQALGEQAQFNLVAVIESERSPYIGQDVNVLTGGATTGIVISSFTSEIIAKTNTHVIIDFTTPDASMNFLHHAAQHKIAHVIGSTGFSAEYELEIQKYAKDVPIVKTGNYSIGVNVLAAVVEKVAQILPRNFDAEILEMHHKNKVDAPSGTALLLGKSIANGLNVDLDQTAVYDRHGVTGARIDGSIGFATLRGGSVIGDHSVIFAGVHERLELSHKAESRTIFASGALHAAQWIVQQNAGLYTMQDVLGVNL